MIGPRLARRVESLISDDALAKRLEPHRSLRSAIGKGSPIGTGSSRFAVVERIAEIPRVGVIRDVVHSTADAAAEKSTRQAQVG